jgi:hypothetical protein
VSNLVDRLAKAEEFLAEGQDLIDAMSEGNAKEEMMKGLEYSMLWHEEIRQKVEG